MTGFRTGTPGRNWDNPANALNSRWNGHVVTHLQREYQFWRETILSKENVAGAMMAKRAQVSDELRHELEAAEGHVVAALRDQAAESEREIKRLLAPVVNAELLALSSLALSMNRCAESPLRSCIYGNPPQFGATCLFCHLAYR